MLPGVIAISLVLFSTMGACAVSLLREVNRLEAKWAAFMQLHRADTADLLRLLERERTWSRQLREARDDGDVSAEYTAEVALCGIVRQINELEAIYGRIRSERGLLGRLQPRQPTHWEADRETPSDDPGRR